MKSLAKAFLPFAFLACVAGSSHAAYPERVITMIVAFAPGGGTDVVARALAPFLEKHIGGGAKVVVVNRGGAGGDIGFAALAAAAPDGYTIGFINSPSVLTIPIERPAQYTWQRFDLLGNVVDDPGSFVVHADSSIRTLADYATFAKANPGALTVGTPGPGAPGHLAITIFAQLANVKITHVPFKGAGEVRGALAGKQVMASAVSVGEALQAQKGGTPVRIIAQMSAARSSLAPDVATAREQGFDVVMSSLRGLAGPKGLPGELRERLVKAVREAVGDREFLVKATQYFAPLRYLSPSAFESAMREDEIQLRQLWKTTPWADK